MVKEIVTLRELERAFAAADDMPVIVDFYAPWCGPCMNIAPRIEEFSKKYDNVIVLKVNVDKSEEIADKYDINSLPTFKVFIRGQPVRGQTVTNASVPLVESLFKKNHNY